MTSSLSFPVNKINSVKFFNFLHIKNISDTKVDLSYPSQYSYTEIIILAIIITIMMIIVVVGNMLVIIAIATEHSLNTVQNWFIASLAFADLSLGLIIMPFSLAHEVGSNTCTSQQSNDE